MEILQIKGKTDVGSQRKDNQDTFICEYLWSSKDIALIAVIDGVGGYAGGDRAAAIARDTILKYMNSPKGDSLTMLREALIYANNQVEEERKKEPGFSEMCCVVTAAVADPTNNKFYFTHVGDTRLYRYNGETLQKITNDHSLVGIREDAGEISETEAMNHPQRNIILRELGSLQHRIDDTDFLEYGEGDFLPGDILLICSDGLSDMITSKQIIAGINSDPKLINKVTNLIAKANEMGGKDNITVVLAQNKLPEALPEKNKKITGQVPVEIITSVNVENAVPEKSVYAEPVKASQKQPKKAKLLLPVIIILLLLAAPIAFYILNRDAKKLIVPSIPVNAAVNTKPQDNSSKDSPVTDLIAIKPRAANDEQEQKKKPELVLTDTIIVTTPRTLKEIIERTGKPGSYFVIIPSKTANIHSPAIQITAHDSTFIRDDSIEIANLHFKDFETAIKVDIPVSIKFENIIFENIKYPLNNFIRKGNGKKSTVSIKNSNQ